MSDIEYNVNQSKKTLESEDEFETLKVPKKTLKRKGASQHPKRGENSGWLLDSDEELEERHASKSQKKPKKVTKKPGSRASEVENEEEHSSKSKKIKPLQATPESKPGWFSNWGDEDELELQRRASEANYLTSVLTRRVAGGYVRRSASLAGDLFIDLKLYNVDDLQNVPPQCRWEKALINFKYRVDSDSAVVEGINKILKRCKEDFTDEGTFFPDKKSQ